MSANMCMVYLSTAQENWLTIYIFQSNACQISKMTYNHFNMFKDKK